MSLPNMRILFKNMTDEEFKKERGDCLEQEELR